MIEQLDSDDVKYGQLSIQFFDVNTQSKKRPGGLVKAKMIMPKYGNHGLYKLNAYRWQIQNLVFNQ